MVWMKITTFLRYDLDVVIHSDGMIFLGEGEKMIIYPKYRLNLENNLKGLPTVNIPTYALFTGLGLCKYDILTKTVANKFAPLVIGLVIAIA